MEGSVSYSECLKRHQVLVCKLVGVVIIMSLLPKDPRQLVGLCKLGRGLKIQSVIYTNLIGVNVRFWAKLLDMAHV